LTAKKPDSRIKPQGKSGKQECPVFHVLSGRKEIYAVIETGGKQYKVTPGQTIEVERLPVEAGSTVELDRVLLVAEGERVIVGTPTIKGARVTATALGEEKGEKIIVFKYKPKVRYRRKKGHRQIYTRLSIEQIVVGESAN
jgi:large subunit ribosomal protein L21